MNRIFGSNHLLYFILGFAFLTRFFQLWIPQNFYFDEVYHAFTAREFLLGNPAAWEFSATPPAGFAYEWTHPPLAKLLMAFGMLIFGQNAFGWRFFGALFGVGIIFLTYLLGKKLFRSELVGLIAALILSLDGLLFVQSRIGMNDVYFLFFTLTSIYFLLNRDYLASGLFLGFSLSSKWTAFWTIFVVSFFLLHQVFLNREKIRDYLFRTIPLWLFSFILVPSIVYLSAYLPFFIQGRELSDFWDLQKQMYWYHTNLEATHPYQSLWYTWPILIRPVWYFVSSQGGLVANIYALGNPLFFWFGLFALLAVGLKTIKVHPFPRIFTLFLYFIFFTPWVLSPRVMFLYHYLPSLPFLAIITGFFLNEISSTKWGKIFTFSFVGFCALIFLYFYPHWAAVHVPRWLSESYFWLPTWR